MKHFEPIKYFLILFFCFSINIAFSNEVVNDELDNNELVESVLQEEQEITEEKPLTLFDLIDLALKNNPKTKISYNSIVLMNNKIINNSMSFIFICSQHSSSSLNIFFRISTTS